MSPREPGLDGRVRELESAVERLSERLRALEKSVPLGHAPTTPDDDPSRADALSALTSPSTAVVDSRSSWMMLTGRAFLALAGAFLLRALTDAGQLSPRPGVWLGLAYALLWLGLAARATGSSSQTHGLTSLLIGLPLVFEAAQRFGALTAGMSTLLLNALALGALAVAVRHALPWLALAAVPGAMATALAVAIAQDAFVAATAGAIALACAAVWAGERRGWTALSWSGVLFPTLMGALLAIRASSAPPRDSPVATLAVLAVLVAVALGSTLVRVVLRDRSVRTVDIAHTALAMTVGLAAAILIARTHRPAAVAAIGLGCGLSSLVCYSLAFGAVSRRHGRGREYQYVAMTALALALVAIRLVAPAPVSAHLTGIGALAASLAAWRGHQPLMALQGAIAAVTAAVQSGLAGFVAAVWLAAPDRWPPAGGSLLFVLLVMTAALAVPRAAGSAPGAAAEPAAPAIGTAAARATLTAALAAGAASLLLAAPAAASPAFAPAAGTLATMRTLLLAGAAILLAVIGRYPRVREATWVAYAALAAGAAKLAIEDLPRSRPATLFVALAAYGAALIVVPWIQRRAARPTPSTGSAPRLT